MKIKTITCVYQDCPLCGDKGKVVKKIAEEKGLNIEKVSFASPKGKELIHQAVFEEGIKTMPFYTDGEKFSTDITEFTAKKAKKVVKNVKESGGKKDGVDK